MRILFVNAKPKYFKIKELLINDANFAFFINEHFIGIYAQGRSFSIAFESPQKAAEVFAKIKQDTICPERAKIYIKEACTIQVDE